MPRNAKIALTETGQDNVNRLRVPVCNILSLRLEMGGKKSKYYLPDGAPKPKETDDGSDNFHFAPGKETISIVYEVDNEFGIITTAKLELFSCLRKAPIWVLDLTELGDTWYSAGKHTVKWDGRLISPKAPQTATEGSGGLEHDLTKYAADTTVNEDLPDGYITLGLSYYKLKLTIGAGNEHADYVVGWTYFHILAKRIALELGDKKAIPKAALNKPDLNLKLYEDTDTDALNGALPAGANRKKLFLTSNIYSLSSAEMHTTTDFDQYKTLWDNGPSIPIFAKIWISDSADTEVEAPLALGKTRFLWDLEDIAETSGSIHTNHHAKAKTFVEDATTFYTDNTHAFNRDPKNDATGKIKQHKGDNCHVDRGGKRGDATASYFPKQNGYAPQDTLKDREFPFEVEACPTRKWAAFSYAWTTKVLANKTGVIFQPSRMAGDAYKFSVYIAWERTLDNAKKEQAVLDITDDPPLKVQESLKAVTGTLEVWRRLNFIQYRKKTGTVTPNFPVATFQGYYEKAYVQMKDDTGGSTTMTKADYDAKATTAINTQITSQDWIKHAFASGSQYDAGDYALKFNNFATFKNNLRTNGTTADPGPWTLPDLNVFLGTVLNTAAKYNKYMSGIASSALTEICTGMMLKTGTKYTHGVNLFQFNEHYNLATQPGGERLNGFAPGTAVDRNACLFVLCAGPTNYTGTNNKAEQTVAHEIGHCLFLAHASDGVTAVDISNRPDPAVHDDAFHNCTMSYNYSAERKFCGFCLLRLRGWKRDTLDKTSANNKKP